MSEAAPSTYVLSSSKPDIADISRVLERQIIPGNDDGLVISHDELGNKVFQSQAYTVAEPLSGDRLPLTLVLSEEGKKLLNANPGLLRSITQPSPEYEQLLPEGTESKNFVVPLSGNKFVLKYLFPVRGDKLRTFTSGIDQMRFLQTARRELGPTGITFIEPVLSSHQVMLAPYHPSIVSLSNAFRMLYLNDKRDKVVLDQNQFLTQVVSAIRARDDSRQDLIKIIDGVHREVQIVENWTQTAMKRKGWFSKFLVNDVSSNCHLDFAKILALLDLTREQNQQDFSPQQLRSVMVFNELVSNTKNAHDR